MRKLLLVLALALLSGCASYDIHFNKYAEQTTHNG